MKSQIEGDNLKVWVNDILYDFGDISSPAFSIPAAGGIGVWTNNAHVRFDDIIVTGTAVVPEPTSATLLGLGALAIAGFIRKRMAA
jgi:hypothetical protein